MNIPKRLKDIGTGLTALLTLPTIANAEIPITYSSNILNVGVTEDARLKPRFTSEGMFGEMPYWVQMAGDFPRKDERRGEQERISDYSLLLRLNPSVKQILGLTAGIVNDHRVVGVTAGYQDSRDSRFTQAEALFFFRGHRDEIIRSGEQILIKAFVPGASIGNFQVPGNPDVGFGAIYNNSEPERHEPYTAAFLSSENGDQGIATWFKRDDMNFRINLAYGSGSPKSGRLVRGWVDMQERIEQFSFNLTTSQYPDDFVGKIAPRKVASREVIDIPHRAEEEVGFLVNRPIVGNALDVGFYRNKGEHTRISGEVAHVATNGIGISYGADFNFKFGDLEHAIGASYSDKNFSWAGRFTLPHDSWVNGDTPYRGKVFAELKF